MRKKTGLFFIILIIAGCLNSFAGSASVKARLDSVNLLMGNVMTLHLEVVENQGSQGAFPILKELMASKGYVGICGDSVELRRPFVVDTTDLGSGKVQLNYEIPVQAFDSGTYTFPKFAYVVGKDTAYSNHLTFNVVPVNVTAEDEIAGFAPVEEPDGKRFYDWVPDWILDFWWIFIVIALAICLFLWALRRYRKEGLPAILSKPVVTPWDAALKSLGELKEKNLWQQGMEKEYFTELTDILRVYLFQRFGINAMEMTTRQIMDRIYNSDLKDKKDYVRHILNVADFVKFAKVRPLPADNVAAFENAVKFVNETIPASSEAKPDDDTIKKEGEQQA